MKKLSKYLLWAFGVAWGFQIIAGILYRKGNSMSYSVLLAVSMFAPLRRCSNTMRKTKTDTRPVTVWQLWNLC